jgi:hypothetical protein
LAVRSSPRHGRHADSSAAALKRGGKPREKAAGAAALAVEKNHAHSGQIPTLRKRERGDCAQKRAESEEDKGLTTIDRLP